MKWKQLIQQTKSPRWGFLFLEGKQQIRAQECQHLVKN